MNAKINPTECPHELLCLTTAECQLRQRADSVPAALKITVYPKINLDKPLPTSGYTPCACRDCFDVAISTDVRKPARCGLCEQAECDATGQSDCDRADAYVGDLYTVAPSLQGYDAERNNPFR